MENVESTTQSFVEASKTYVALANRIKELLSSLSTVNGDNNKIIVLNQLVLCVNDFDDQVKFMIKEFPEFSKDKKVTDTLLAENLNLLKVTMEELQKLNKFGLN